MSLRHSRVCGTPLAALSHRKHYPLVLAAGFGFGKEASNTSKQCPCGSGHQYQACCQRYHKSLTIQAPTPEAVLRARFSAYAKKEWKYIVRTTHPDNPTTKGSVSADGKVRTTFEEDVKVAMYNAEFVKLTLLREEAGSSADEAILEFQVDFKQKLDEKARKLDKAIPRSIRERALFLRNGDGAWEFRQALDSNWDRHNLEYTGAGGTTASPVAA